MYTSLIAGTGSPAFTHLTLPPSIEPAARIALYVAGAYFLFTCGGNDKLMYRGGYAAGYSAAKVEAIPTSNAQEERR